MFSFNGFSFFALCPEIGFKLGSGFMLWIELFLWKFLHYRVESGSTLAAFFKGTPSSSSCKRAYSNDIMWCEVLLTLKTAISGCLSRAIWFRCTLAPQMTAWQVSNWFGWLLIGLRMLLNMFHKIKPPHQSEFESIYPLFHVCLPHQNGLHFDVKPCDMTTRGAHNTRRPTKSGSTFQFCATLPFHQGSSVCCAIWCEK